MTEELSGRNIPVEVETVDLPARIREQWDSWSPERKRLYERRKVNNSVRYRILKRDGFRCQICGRDKDDLDDEGKPVRLHVDHKESMANDGKSEEDNLWTLCFDCNRGKGTHSLDEELEEEETGKPEVIQPRQRATRVKEITLADGRTGWEYSDGSLRNERGHMIQPLPGTQPITHENARILIQSRWEQSREAFATGLAEGMGTSVPVDAWQYVGRKAGQLLQEAKSAKGFADLARFSGESAGFVRGKNDQPTQDDDNSVRSILRDVADIARASVQLHDTIDGVLKD